MERYPVLCKGNCKAYAGCARGADRSCGTRVSYFVYHCIPVTGMVKVICDNAEALKPYGFIRGEEINFDEPRSKRPPFWKKDHAKK